MPTVAPSLDGLGQYLTALEQLAHAHRHLDVGTVCTAVLAESAPPEALDELVATLCRHARAGADLASGAESLCSALVAERYQLRR